MNIAVIPRHKGLEGFDEGTINSGLEKRDSTSWQFKSWVVGIEIAGHAKAYDWNDLVKQRVINDTFQNTALVLELENDNRSFHVWNSLVNGTWIILHKFTLGILQPIQYGI